MVDTGLGWAECQGLGTEWAVLTNEVSEVESRKYLRERQAGLAGEEGSPAHPDGWGLQRFSVPGRVSGPQDLGSRSTLLPLMGLDSL